MDGIAAFHEGDFSAKCV